MIPFLFTNFTTLFTLSTRSTVGLQGAKNNAQSTKQNTSMKSKLSCKNSMLREFVCRLRRSEQKHFFALFTFEKFMSLFSSFHCPVCYVSWHEFTSPLLLATMDEVYMIHGEILMQSVWIAFLAVKWNCIWHWTGLWRL